jgi:hypothetical protein
LGSPSPTHEHTGADGVESPDAEKDDGHEHHACGVERALAEVGEDYGKHRLTELVKELENESIYARSQETIVPTINIEFSIIFNENDVPVPLPAVGGNSPTKLVRPKTAPQTASSQCPSAGRPYP